MTRRAVTLQHAVAVAKNFDTIVAVKTAAFGIGNAFVRLQCRLFCAGRQFNGFIRGNFRSAACTVRAMACGLKSVDDALPLRFW